jgi:hypothetical protein
MRTDQDMHAAELNGQPFDSRNNLFVIPHIGPQALRHAAGMLNLELSQVKLGLASRQQADSCPARRKTDGQPLSDASAGSGDQN